MNTSRGFVSFGLILAVIIGLVVLGGAGYYATQKNALQTSNKNATTTQQVQQSASQSVPSSDTSADTKASVTIDQSSLTTTSGTPTITGTEKSPGYGVLNVNILEANTGEQLFSGNIPVTNNTWAFKVSSEFSVRHSSLVPGIYKVVVSDKSGSVLAEDNLIIR